MSVSFNIRIEGFERFNAVLSGVESKMVSLEPFWEICGEEFRYQENRLFAAAPWKPLTPAYAEQKRRKFGEKPILRARDILYRSLTQKDAEGNVTQIDRLEAEFGSDVPYGVFHRATRDPVVEPDLNRYETLIGEYMLEAVRGV